MESDTEVVLSADQAARRLGVSVQSVRRLGNTGELPTVRYLHRMFFKRDDIDEFIEQHIVEV